MNKTIARWAVVLIILISLVLGYFIKDLKFNYVFEDFFPVNDPDLAYYQDFKEMFDNDNDYLLIGLVNRPSIFEQEFLTKLDSLVQELNRLDNVAFTNALTTIEKPVISPAGLFKISVIHPEDPNRYAQDSIRIYNNQLLVESIVSQDGAATAILLRHDFLSNKEAADTLVNQVESTIQQFNFQKYYIAGKTYAQGVFIDKMQTELMVFLSASVILVIAFLAFAYRSWWGVLVPLLVVMLATVWILGLMGLTGKTLDILMVLLPTIMFVVGMSDVVHIMTKYIEQLRLGQTKIQAIKVTFKEVGIATFLTSLTTSIGFLTLFTASIAPIQEFGLYTAIGVFFAFIVAFGLLPSCLVFLDTPKVSRKVLNRSAWFGSLIKAYLYVLTNGKKVILVNVLLTGVAIYGVSQIVINTYLIEDLPSDAPLKQSFTFFDDNFGGSRPFEITATVDSTRSIYDPAVINEIEKVENYLETDFKAGNIVSPVTIVKGLTQAINGGVSNAFILPDNSKEWKTVNKYLKRTSSRELTYKVTARDNTVGRITARVGDIGSKISLERTAHLKEFFKTNTDTSLVDFKVTGTSNLIDKNNEYLSKNMFQGLGIAFGVVAIIAGIMFRSFRMIIITLIPNVIPLILVAGIMGIFGITLKLSTSIIFTIAFGIAVDDTIHFISKLKIELNKGKSMLYALKRTYLSTGKAIIVTSLILSAGFLTLLLSSFGGTFYTGLLISLTLIFALIIDLTLLPVLIVYFYKPKK